MYLRAYMSYKVQSMLRGVRSLDTLFDVEGRLGKGNEAADYAPRGFCPSVVFFLEA